MALSFQEHDALIIAAARGILQRTETEAYGGAPSDDGLEAARAGRVAEACSVAADAISNALITLEVFGHSEHAGRALHSGAGDAPPSAEVPA